MYMLAKDNNKIIIYHTKKIFRYILYAAYVLINKYIFFFMYVDIIRLVIKTMYNTKLFDLIYYRLII